MISKWQVLLCKLKNNGSVVKVVIKVTTSNTPDSRWYRNDLIKPNPMIYTPEKGVSSICTDNGISVRFTHKKGNVPFSGL